MRNFIKLRRALENIIKDEIDLIVKPLMDRFDGKIIPFEDETDPARPSVFRDEFEKFLRVEIRSKIKTKIVNDRTIEAIIELGEFDKLGIGERLDENTTDGLKIIGTIIQGIEGNYVLVTSEMTGGPEGRFGRAFIMLEEQYRKEASGHDWDPNKPVWSFSNFPGVPDFFSNLDLTKLVKKILLAFGARK
ncbi:hypothetical protein LCGC14_1272250 [marine sediment metagenome]|uniref:Uncharacterized protein n=1 Tax=marine sediment metagenome TaxID=412755 RepID=A0A0F9P0R2_9ZZZZ|nr:hypothetical protein [bacterium]